MNKSNNDREDGQLSNENIAFRYDSEITHGTQKFDKILSSTFLNVNRSSLEIILRDQKLQKIFLTLTMLCDIVIISEVKPPLK